MDLVGLRQVSRNGRGRSMLGHGHASGRGNGRAESTGAPAGGSAGAPRADGWAPGLGILAISGAQGGRVPSYTADKMLVKSPDPPGRPPR